MTISLKSKVQVPVLRQPPVTLWIYSFFTKFTLRIKYCNFNWFPGVEILWKCTVSTKFWKIRPKLCGNCAFPQNSHTRKLGKITVAVYAVLMTTNFSKLCKSWSFLPNWEYYKISMTLTSENLSINKVSVGT